MPETADDLMGLIMRHTAAGPTARFAAAQLLTIAAKCTVSWPYGMASLFFGVERGCSQLAALASKALEV